MKVLGSGKNFLAIEDQYSSLADSAIAIVSAPYEHTVSYGHGAKKGPKAIIKSSGFVEFYDDEFNRELCFEKGIATIAPIDFGDAVDEHALSMIESTVAQLLDMDKFVVTLGGEHTISTAPISAHYRRFPNMSILHFDAHSDLRLEYQGNKYSHASFMARVCEFFPSERVVQVGIRAQCLEEAQYILDNEINTFYASAIRRGLHGQNWQKSVVDALGDEVYVTFDVDYFDPAIMPSTGTPEPDGFLYSETLDIFRLLRESGRKIIGLDVVELAPEKGKSHPDILTARLIYKILNMAFTPIKSNKSNKGRKTK